MEPQTHLTQPSNNHHDQVHDEDDELLILKPAAWLITLVALLAQLITTLLFTLLTPLFLFGSMVSHSLRRADEARHRARTTVRTAPSRVARASVLLLKRIGFGVVGAVNACVVMVALMVVAVVVGVGLVRLWVEEPVVVREMVYFDYTDVSPSAVLGFGEKKRAVPVGHRFFVSLELLVPDSDFNRQIGVFQVTAEVLSGNGKVLARSSQPCTLRFRSLPIRLMRTFIFSVPLLLGLSSETQKISIRILQHKEGKPRTEAIRAKLVPRAGTSALPELYSAEIILNSRLPWRKQLIHNWKWTLYVWASLNMYIVVLITTLCCCRPLLFPIRTTVPVDGDGAQRDWSMEGEEDFDSRELDWQPSMNRRRRRSKRKVVLQEHGDFDETVGSSGFGSAVTSEEASEVVDSSGLTDAESVCLDG